MSSTPNYQVRSGVGGNPNQQLLLNVSADSGGFEWLHYIGYFLAALIVVWGVLFALLRLGVIGPRDWLYNKTTWIPFLGQHSWARKNFRQ